MRRKNLRKVIAGVMALTMVALSMGIVSAADTKVSSTVSAAVVAVDSDQEELSEFRDEIISDLELFEEGLSDMDEEIGKIVSSGKTAVEAAVSFDELEAVWQVIKTQINALSLV